MFYYREFTLKESFWFALTSFTPQGGGEAPKALSGRTLVAAYWLFVVLMLATFTANLAAFLTVERMKVNPLMKYINLHEACSNKNAIILILHLFLKNFCTHKYPNTLFYAKERCLIYRSTFYRAINTGL